MKTYRASANSRVPLFPITIADGEGLAVNVLGTEDPLMLTITESPTGASVDFQFSANAGVFSIPAAQLSGMYEGVTYQVEIWAEENGMPVQKMYGQITKQSAIPPNASGNPTPAGIGAMAIGTTFEVA